MKTDTFILYSLYITIKNRFVIPLGNLRFPSATHPRLSTLLKEEGKYSPAPLVFHENDRIYISFEILYNTAE
jgi:hypothetical protein